MKRKVIFSEEYKEKLSIRHLGYALKTVTILEGEEWKDIKDCPGWKISTFGRVSKDGFLRNPQPKDARVVTLRVEGKSAQFSIIKLVLLTFVGPPPPGKEIARHLDDDITNNTLKNAAWGSRADNAADALRNGKLDFSLERNAKISASKKGRWIGGISNNAGRIAITNGVVTKRLPPGSEIPFGWQRGRAKTDFLRKSEKEKK